MNKVGQIVSGLEVGKIGRHIYAPCPKCGARMSMGISHADYGTFQWECHDYGYCEVQND